LARKGKTVTDSELKYPSWQTPLQEAMLEVNPKKLAKKIQKLETIIFKRLLEMSSDTDHEDERHAIADAASILRVLKKDRLSYPDWSTQKHD
jgi:hypothetical protein